MDDIDIANYADDNTPDITGGNIDGVITSQENDSKLAEDWLMR